MGQPLVQPAFRLGAEQLAHQTRSGHEQATRAPLDHLTKEASAVAKMLCRKYSGKTGDEMFAAFLETVNRSEFKALVVELVGESEKKFGRNAQGRIRVRPERKDLAGNAAKARAGRKKKS